MTSAAHRAAARQHHIPTRFRDITSPLAPKRPSFVGSTAAISPLKMPTSGNRRPTGPKVVRRGTNTDAQATEASALPSPYDPSNFLFPSSAAPSSFVTTSQRPSRSFAMFRGSASTVPRGSSHRAPRDRPAFADRVPSFVPCTVEEYTKGDHLDAKRFASIPKKARRLERGEPSDGRQGQLARGRRDAYKARLLHVPQVTGQCKVTGSCEMPYVRCPE